MERHKGYKNKVKRQAYLNEYQKKNYKRYLLCFDKEKDSQLINELDESDSKIGKIREWYQSSKK